jgi:hypothetical protein
MQFVEGVPHEEAFTRRIHPGALKPHGVPGVPNLDPSDGGHHVMEAR